MNSNFGKYTILAGLSITAIGLLIYFLGDKLNWIGKLPGDINWTSGKTKIYFPVVTMILLSLLLNLIIYLIKRFL